MTCQNRCDCKLWDACWFYCVFGVFLYVFHVWSVTFLSNFHDSKLLVEMVIIKKIKKWDRNHVDSIYGIHNRIMRFLPKPLFQCVKKHLDWKNEWKENRSQVSICISKANSTWLKSNWNSFFASRNMFSMSISIKIFFSFLNCFFLFY